MNRFISIGLLLLCFDRSAALNVHIAGVAEGRIVGTAYAYKNLGAFTSQRIILDECDIDSAGNFRLSFECVETQQIFISINRVSANLYVHPGDVFNVLFPSEEHVDFRSFANSRVRLKIEPKSNLTDTLWQIDSAISGFVNDYFFDYAFQQFRGPESYLDEARRRAPGADLFKISAESDSSYDVDVASVRNSFDSFSKELFLRFGPSISEYTRQYLLYSLAELELMTLPTFNSFFHRHFAEKPVQLGNTAYVRTFRAFFHGFFEKYGKQLSAGWSESWGILNSSLEGLLHSHSDDVYACLWISHVLNNRALWPDAAQGKNVVLEEIQKHYQGFVAMSEAVLGLKRQASFVSSGRKVESLRMSDARGELWKLSEVGSTYKYFLFFTKWNTESLKELQLLERLSEQMRGLVNVYAVSCDQDFATFKKFVSGTQSSPIVYLFGGSNPVVDDECGLKLIPAALFLDSENNTIMPHAPLPSGKLEGQFKRITDERRKPQQKRKTWKD